MDPQSILGMLSRLFLLLCVSCHLNMNKSDKFV